MDKEDGDTALALELFELLPYCNQGDESTDKLVLTSLAGQDIDFLTVDDTGNTLLMIACQYRLEAACKIMIEHNVDVNSKNAMGASPLHFACADGTCSIEVADLLLRHGANVNSIESSTGCTPIHYSSLVSDIEFVHLLLRSRADPLAEDYENFLPVDYAKDVMLSEHEALLTAAGTAKRKGPHAYEAFLDNLPAAAGSSSVSMQLPSLGGSDDNEIDSLLSELDMDLTNMSNGGHSAVIGSKEATDSELQDILMSIFNKEGMGSVSSSKKSLVRSMTVCR
jgi:hypothetical protein